jgi:hypothetical protein
MRDRLMLPEDVRARTRIMECLAEISNICALQRELVPDSWITILEPVIGSAPKDALLRVLEVTEEARRADAAFNDAAVQQHWSSARVQ